MTHHSSNFAQVPTRENQAVPQLQFCIAQGASSKKSIEMVQRSRCLFSVDGSHESFRIPVPQDRQGVYCRLEAHNH